MYPSLQHVSFNSRKNVFYITYDWTVIYKIVIFIYGFLVTFK